MDDYRKVTPVWPIWVLLVWMAFAIFSCQRDPVPVLQTHQAKGAQP